MNAKQKMLVQLSFTKLSAHTDEVAESFYHRLFALAPEAQERYEGIDMKAQGRKLVQTLGLTVRLLDRDEEITSELARMGWQAGHVALFDLPVQIMESALLQTLEERLGDDFGRDERIAWAEVFRRAVAAMQQMAEEVDEGAAAPP